VKAVSNQLVPSWAEWWGEMDNRATTPFGYGPSTALLWVRPHCVNARWNRCQNLNSFPLGELEETTRSPGRPRTTWMKTIQQDLKSNNLSLVKQLTWLRTVHSGDWCLRLAIHTPSGACS